MTISNGIYYDENLGDHVLLAKNPHDSSTRPRQPDPVSPFPPNAPEGPDSSRRSLPLLSVQMTVDMGTSAFRTRLVQTFQNPFADDISETEYVFPLFNNCAVVSFTCIIKNRTVLRGRVKPKDIAQDAFHSASSRGDPAGLLEERTPDVFSTTLGRIPRRSTVTVDIAYIGELKHDMKRDVIRLTIPTSIAPRYGWGTARKFNTDNTQIQQRGLSVKVNMEVMYPILNIASVHHQISYGPDNHHISFASFRESIRSSGNHNCTSVPLSLAHGTAPFDKDFVLDVYVQPGSLSPSMAILERSLRGENEKAFMLSLGSSFSSLPSSTSCRRDIIFIADRSGSMTGKMNTLISAMEVFLHSLNGHCKFNVWCFGSHTTSLWPQSKSYSNGNFKEALAYVEGFNADMGGTELLEALRTAANTIADQPQTVAEIIVLTDGQVVDPNSVFALVNDIRRRRPGKVRVFAMGVGDSVSHALVEGIARAGGGYAEVVSVHGESGWEDRVINMLDAALHENVDKVTLQFMQDHKKIGPQHLFPAGEFISS
jgi:von Willebrand factor type A domain/Vault protein inter-alpha-trypsin domain